MADKSEYYDPEKGYLFNPETGADATGRMYFAPQATADYMAKEGTLQPYEPTMRENTRQAIVDFLSQYGGLSKFGARDIAEGVTGSTSPDARNPMGIGLMDFTPAGLVFGAQEAGRDFDKAETATDYIAPTIGLGLSAVEAFPLTKAITKPAAAFLSNLGRKTAGQEVVDLSRRDVAKKLGFGLAAAPAVAVGAGALSKLPIEKAVKTPVDYSDLISSVRKDFAAPTLEDVNVFKLTNYFKSPKELFDWFDSGITENLLLPEPKRFLDEAGGDLEKANDKIMQEIEDLVGDVDFQNDDTLGIEFFRENITEPLIEDLTKAAE
jgi:hypothetical protein